MSQQHFSDYQPGNVLEWWANQHLPHNENRDTSREFGLPPFNYLMRQLNQPEGVLLNCEPFSCNPSRNWLITCTLTLDYTYEEMVIKRRWEVKVTTWHDGGEVEVEHRPILYLDTIAQEAGWTSGPVCRGTENLAPHRDSIPGPPSPYRVATTTPPFRPQAEL